ncbi:membrane-bound lytic murein transglycosylase MltF [Planctobacterium marinum]|uniref:membrane-bound lytic murein transglycosylase MltF n=1 Tax=Planctobacterium marinum TaxID=1631968 RepID=UPI001E5980FB|nr:membrane-bound lytic murein transglycosylase MltF [Planctobacterium marinum]MCC2606297.1 membrane-bound lytic murein transglycosylase MltF [Planctobacterium marinum]
MKKVFQIALIIGLTGGCQQQLPDANLLHVSQQGVLKVGMQYGPTTYLNGAVEPLGYEYEMARGFADYLGVKLEVFPYYASTSLLRALDKGNIDLIASNLTVTDANRAYFKFGPAYQNVSEKLVFLQGNVRPRSFDDLAGTLVIASDTSDSHVISEVTQAYENQLAAQWQFELTDEQDELELLENVVNGVIDYTIVDSNLLSLVRRKHPELSVGFSVTETHPIAWVTSVKTDDSLNGALIEYFGNIKQNGQLAALEDKYFGHVRQFNYVDTTLFLKAAKEVLPKYEAWFRQYAGDIDWRLLAAMSYQESHWDPRAKSPTGVRGMMMLTLPTARDWKVTSRLDPEQSIRGGSQYFNSLLSRIPDRIQYPDRLWFALAAYNIGLGHLEDARVLTERQGANPDLWVDVKKHLPLLRQKRYYKTTRYGYARGHEALNYVTNIRRYYDSLVYYYDEHPDPANTEVSE